MEFVDGAIAELVQCGSAKEAHESNVHVISPLGVVEGKKLRLILDLRYVNSHLATFPFKCDGLDCLVDMYKRHDWIVQFDLKSAYHHIDMWPVHTKYLGFQWKGRLFVFCSLPFGLSTAPFCFYKITRVLVKFWRGKGFRCFLFYDDGSLAHQDRELSFSQGQIVKADVLRSGFLLSDPKCKWDPAQCVELLGYEVDTVEGLFKVPNRRLEKFEGILQSVWHLRKSVKARRVAQVVGHVLSMRLAIGPVTRLWTRALYRAIEKAPHYGAHTHLDADACRELDFWRNQFSQAVSFPIWPVSSRVEILSYSDASNVAWAGVMRVDAKLKAHGNWELGELGPHTSSTWREIRAVHLLLLSASQFLSGRFVCHHTDNQNVDRILRNGSQVRNLQDEAVGISDLCIKHFIWLEVKWIPQVVNPEADYLSKFICNDDFWLAAYMFAALDQLWGPHSVDWIESHLS